MFRFWPVVLIVVAACWPAPVTAQTRLGLGAGAVRWTPAEWTQTAEWAFRQEQATASAVFTRNADIGFDLSARRLWRLGGRLAIGTGVALTRVQGRSAVAVNAEWPHPILFDRPASASLGAPRSAHRDLGLHAEAVAGLRLGRHAVLAFAGPSWLRTRQDVVSGVEVQESLLLTPTLPYSIQLAGVTLQAQRASDWGYHAGAEFDARLTRRLGVAVSGRYVHARLRLPNPLQDSADGGGGATGRQTVGGVLVTAGIRVGL